MLTLAAVVAVSLTFSACSTWSGFAAPHPGQFRERPEVPLGETAVKLHLSRPSGGDPPRLLLFHVTGDAGWFGLDTLYFETMASRGYTLGGVSARALRAHLASPGAGATPARLAADYLALIAAAEARLQLAPGTPVVLTGLSRGAGLTVVAASQPELGRRIAGVLIMSLTADEGTVRPAAAPFALIDRIGRPLVLLQSTVDRHVPADDARRLFGPDLPGRKLVAIEADGHTFGGHRDELFRQVEGGLDWIAVHPQPSPAFGLDSPDRSRKPATNRCSLLLTCVDIAPPTTGRGLPRLPSGGDHAAGVELWD